MVRVLGLVQTKIILATGIAKRHRIRESRNTIFPKEARRKGVDMAVNLSRANFTGCLIVGLLCSVGSVGIAQGQTCSSQQPFGSVPQRMFLRASGVATDRIAYIGVFQTTGPSLVLRLKSGPKGAPYTVFLRKPGASFTRYYCTAVGILGDDEDVHYERIDYPLVGSVPLQVDVYLGGVPGASVNVDVFEALNQTVTIKGAGQPTKITIQGKSFIGRMATQKAIDQGHPDDETNANLGFEGLVGGRVVAYELLLATDQLFSENPLTGSREGEQFRLWTAVDASITCVGGKLTGFDLGSLSNAVGKEGPLAAAGEIMTPLASVKHSASGQVTGVEISYAFKGRPNALARPAFEQIRPRTCAWIWHKVTVDLTCVGGDIKATGKIEGSSFPSRRLWVNDKIMADYHQGPFDRLWTCDAQDTSLVR
jgi:hypothetical protein